MANLPGQKLIWPRTGLSTRREQKQRVGREGKTGGGREREGGREGGGGRGPVRGNSGRFQQRQTASPVHLILLARTSCCLQGGLGLASRGGLSSHQHHIVCVLDAAAAQNDLNVSIGIVGVGGEVPEELLLGEKTGQAELVRWTKEGRDRVRGKSKRCHQWDRRSSHVWSDMHGLRLTGTSKEPQVEGRKACLHLPLSR